jgi:outer membrane lipoprotein-sorting protein
MHRVCRGIASVLLGAFVAGTSLGGPADGALKQIGKAMKGVRGVVAEIEYAETAGKRSFSGSGKLYLTFDGSVRVEIEGEAPGTLIFLPPHLHIYREAQSTVEIYDVTFNPHMLGQYVLLGFVPNGKDMKKNYAVEQVPNSPLDDRPVLSFLLTPKWEEAALAIGRIQLWVDPESGLPLQHLMLHSAGESRLDIRYRSISRDDELSPSLFRPDWPAGTKTVRM